MASPEWPAFVGSTMFLTLRTGSGLGRNRPPSQGQPSVALTPPCLPVGASLAQRGKGGPGHTRSLAGARCPGGKPGALQKWKEVKATSGEAFKSKVLKRLSCVPCVATLLQCHLNHAPGLLTKGHRASNICPHPDGLGACACTSLWLLHSAWRTQPSS